MGIQHCHNERMVGVFVVEKLYFLIGSLLQSYMEELTIPKIIKTPALAENYQVI